MPRDYQYTGEILFKVKGGEHLSGRAIGALSELGLSVGPIRISPQYHYNELKVDDFGPDVPCDLQWNLAFVRITATLIHYDFGVLEICESESMAQGGVRVIPDNVLPTILTGRAGTMAPAGKFMRCRKPMYASGNHFFSVNLINTNQVYNAPWRFRMCHLEGQPVVYQIGTNVTQAEVCFRALPYAAPPLLPYVEGVGTPVLSGWLAGGLVYTKPREMLSSGAVVWDRTADT